MNLAKKALSLGTSAALVASLLATVVAPAAFASTSVVSAGSIAAGSTSTGTASFTFTENSATSFTGPGTLTVTILDANSQNTLSFSGGVLAAPASLGASLAVSGNTFTVTTTGAASNSVEQITVSGLKIAASTTAATGGIIATLTGTGGTPASAVITQTTSATGYLYASVGAGSTTGTIALTSTCPFVPTGAGAGPAGDLVINGVDVGSAAIGTPNGQNLQAYTLASSLSAGYAAGVAVTQASVPTCSGGLLPSPGTIGAIVTQNATSTVVFPGQNNQPAGNTSAVEPSAGFLAAGSTATFTLPSGVLFSNAPTATPSGSSGTLAVPTGLTSSQFAGSAPVSPGVLNSGTYYFEVSTKGATSGETMVSAPVAVTLTNGTATHGAISLSWNSVSGSIGGYYVYYSSSLAGPYLRLTSETMPVAGTTLTVGATAAITTSGAVQATDSSNPTVAIPTGLAGSALAGTAAVGITGAGWPAATSRYFVVTAKGTTGETTASTPLHVTIGGSAANLTLSWAAVAGAVSYNVYESLDGVQPYVLAGNSLTSSILFNIPPILGTTLPPTTNTAVGATGAGLTLTANSCALSFDRTSCTVTVSTASTAASAITLSNIHLDLASTVPNGTSVTATLTGSPAFSVYVNSNVIAVVNRTLVGVGATPTVWIGYNAQQSGVLTVTETAAGFFQAGLSNNNAIQVCVADYNPTSAITPSETFTFAPWAVVTTGDVSLLNTSTNVGASSVQGTLNATNTCATWMVYTASTKASTITIVGATTAGALSASVPTNGPTLNIDPAATPGPVTLAVGTGTLTGTTFTALYSTNAVNAIRAFKSGVVVTAVSQPYIGVGAIGAAGNIQVAETLNGQLVAGEIFTCQLLQPNAENNAFWISSQNSNDLPIVATNLSSGLVAHLVPFPIGSNASTFSVMIDQQAVAPNTGTVTISNLHYQTATGAPIGPINVECYNDSVVLVDTQLQRVPSTGAAFDTFISNAINGTSGKLNIAANSALGLNPTSGYTMVTPKYQAVGKYVTWKFTGGMALAGQRVNILVAKHINGAWGGPVYYKSAWADANGIVTFAWTSKTAAAINVRVQWPGSTSYAVSTSKALGAYYK